MHFFPRIFNLFNLTRPLNGASRYMTTPYVLKCHSSNPRQNVHEIFAILNYVGHFDFWQNVTIHNYVQYDPVAQSPLISTLRCTHVLLFFYFVDYSRRRSICSDIVPCCDSMRDTTPSQPQEVSHHLLCISDVATLVDTTKLSRKLLYRYISTNQGQVRFSFLECNKKIK